MPNIPSTADTFKRIVLKDNNDAVVNIVGADSTTDTLTFKVGAGMSISANETSDTISFGITSTVNTAALNDILYNGNTSTYGITVADVTVDNTIINNNKIQVSHATNNLTLETTGTGTVVINDTLTVQHIIPTSDVTYDLGSATYRFRDLYLSGSSIKLGAATITSTATGSGINLPSGSQLGGVDLGAAVLPTQSSQSGKLLSTNGTSPYWTSSLSGVSLGSISSLQLGSGVSISSFSTDNTFANNASDSLPVENAIRGYIDKRLGITHGGSPVVLLNRIGSGFMSLDGQLAMAGDLDMGTSYKIKNLATPVSDTDASTKKFVTDTDATRKTYVDNILKGNSVTIGSGVATGNTGSNVVSIGRNAGQSGSGLLTVSIGDSSGYAQANYAVAVGNLAGSVGQKANSVAIGNYAGRGGNTNSIAIGYNAGAGTSTAITVASVNATAGFTCTATDLSPDDILYVTGTNTGTGTISGYTSGKYYRILTALGPGSTFFIIRELDGSTPTTTSGTIVGLTFIRTASQAVNSIILNGSGALDVGVGYSANSNSFYVTPIRNATTTNFLYYDSSTKEITYGSSIPAGTFGSKIQIGTGAGQTSWFADIAIGYQAQNTGSNINGIAIGYQAGQTSQGQDAVALGYRAGNSSQGQSSISIGSQAGLTGQLAGAISIGYLTNSSGPQGLNAVSIGQSSSLYGQGGGAIAIGSAAGTIPQSSNGVAIGASSHNATTQGSSGVSIGAGSGGNVFGSLSNVSITGTAGQCSSDPTILVAGTPIFIQGTNTGSGSITGYTPGKYYKVGTVTSPVAFTLVNMDGTAIVTSAGTLASLVYLVSQGMGDNVLSLTATGSDTSAVRNQPSSTYVKPIRRFDQPVAGAALAISNVYAGGIFVSSFSVTSLQVGNLVTISGTIAGTGTISGYVPANQNYYYIIATNGAGTIFQLSSTLNGSPITTTTGSFATPTFTVQYNAVYGDSQREVVYNTNTGELEYVTAADSLTLRTRSPASGVSLPAPVLSDSTTNALYTRFPRMPSYISGLGGGEIMIGAQLGFVRQHYALATSGTTGLATTVTLAPIFTGTGTSRSNTYTIPVTRAQRVGYVSAGTAGSTASVSMSTAVTTSNGSGLGGFYLNLKFSITDASIPVSGAIFFAGVASSQTIAATTNMVGNTSLSYIGIGQLSTDATQLYLCYGSGAASSQLALGTGFPANPTIANGSDIYNLQIWFASTSATSFSYHLTRTDSTGAITQTQGSNVAGNIPSFSTALFPIIHRSNNATALAVSVDMMSMVVESAY